MAEIVLIRHGHSPRVAGARWIGLPAAAGRLFGLDTATYSALGFEHGDDPVLACWNG